MAEIVGAVASVAGLVSLSIQLVESTQKLKRLFNACSDAPSTITDLCFDLETMSLSLRQLEAHRMTGSPADELLIRCVTTCTRIVAKIERAVSKIENPLDKTRLAGRLYAAFKKPEIDKLVAELGHAQSTMSFAYMNYCQ